MTQLTLFRNASGRSPSGAEFSACGGYRYRLWREWSAVSSSRFVGWVMLNPSFADAGAIDDPTIKRCINFSRSWGFDRLEVVNLYSLISSDPAALDSVSDPIGPRNGDALEYVGRYAELIVCAWGNHPMAKARAKHVATFLGGSLGKELWCLGLTKDGGPTHPLARGKHRIPDDAKPQRFEPKSQVVEILNAGVPRG